MPFHFISFNIVLLQVHFILIHLTITSTAQVKDCTEDVGKCDETYKVNILKQLNKQSENSVCRVFFTFKRCIHNLDCNLDPEAKYQKFEKYENDLRKNNYNCDKEEEISQMKEVQLVSMSTPTMDKMCTSSEEYCKKEYFQSMYNYSGRNETLGKTEIQRVSCNTAEKYITCERERKECTNAMNTVCSLFQQKNIKCTSIPCVTSLSSTTFSLFRKVLLQLSAIVTVFLLGFRLCLCTES
ncbi:hypothetical protein Btru_022885 [Bulinus truncatus]|nr:hypothetical protein Btru_022885 [Bulinus truncatus]